MASSPDDGWEWLLSELPKEMTKRYVIIYDVSDPAFKDAAEDLEKRLGPDDIEIFGNTLENFKKAFVVRPEVTHLVIHYIGHGVANRDIFPGFPLCDKLPSQFLAARPLIANAKKLQRPVKLIFDCCNIGTGVKYTDACSIMGTFDFLFDDRSFVVCSSRQGQVSFFVATCFTLFICALSSALTSNSQNFQELSFSTNMALISLYEKFKLQYDHPSTLFLWDMNFGQEIDLLSLYEEHKYRKPMALLNRVLIDEIQKAL